MIEGIGGVGRGGEVAVLEMGAVAHGVVGEGRGSGGGIVGICARDVVAGLFKDGFRDMHVTAWRVGYFFREDIPLLHLSSTLLAKTE